MNVKPDFYVISLLLLNLFYFVPIIAQSQTNDQFKVAEVTGYFRSHFMSVQYNASRSVLEKQPHWNPLNGRSLLPPDRACVIALSAVRSDFPNINDWKVNNILLFHLNNFDEQGLSGSENIWYYEIEFAPRDPKVAKTLDKIESDYLLTQIVLLDGTIVQSGGSGKSDSNK